MKESLSPNKSNESETIQRERIKENIASLDAVKSDDNINIKLTDLRLGIQKATCEIQDHRTEDRNELEGVFAIVTLHTSDGKEHSVLLQEGRELGGITPMTESGLFLNDGNGDWSADYEKLADSLGISESETQSTLNQLQEVLERAGVIEAAQNEVDAYIESENEAENEA